MVRLEDPRAVADLLNMLRVTGAHDAVAVLLARDPAAQADPGHPRNVAELLHALRMAGAAPAAATLAIRAAGQAGVEDPRAVAALLGTLCGAGLDEAAGTLAMRAANAGMFGLFLKGCPDQAGRYVSGREPDGTASRPWSWPQPAEQGN
jgi:hypothetical protein